MKYVLVGDIHGKVDVVKRALDRDGKIVFVGDFMDSFNRSNAEHSACLRLICDAIRAGKAEAIFGNHELSYMESHHRCSGFDVGRLQIMHAYEPELRELFKSHLLLAPNFLVTHAGLTKQLWDDYELTIDLLDQILAEWWPNIDSPMHFIGRYRGGRDLYGGTFWCDFNAEFEPVPNLTQVFGHTAGEPGRHRESSFCIDCLDHEEIFMEVEL